MYERQEIEKTSNSIFHGRNYLSKDLKFYSWKVVMCQFSYKQINFEVYFNKILYFMFNVIKEKEILCVCVFFFNVYSVYNFLPLTQGKEMWFYIIYSNKDLELKHYPQNFIHIS